jgi:hypothetical protein
MNTQMPHVRCDANNMQLQAVLMQQRSITSWFLAFPTPEAQLSQCPFNCHICTCLDKSLMRQAWPVTGRCKAMPDQ